MLVKVFDHLANTIRRLIAKQIRFSPKMVEGVGQVRLDDLGQVLAFINNNAALRSFKKVAEDSLTSDPGHDLFHALRVGLWTLRLNSKLRPENALAAALLHDIVNIPKNDPRRSQASQLSAEVARSLLQKFPDAYSQDDIDDICGAIRDHSFSYGAIPETDLGKALQDADRLEALGVLGAFRNISCGTQMGAVFFHPTDPWAQNRDLNDKQYSVDHYECKLLKLEDLMNTELGKIEARKRTERLTRLLQELGDEIGIPYVSFKKS